jgi:hypothetical protein
MAKKKNKKTSNVDAAIAAGEARLADLQRKLALLDAMATKRSATAQSLFLPEEDVDVDVEHQPALDVAGMTLEQYAEQRASLPPGVANANGRPRRVGRRTSAVGVLGDMDGSPQDRAATVAALVKAGTYTSGGMISG